MRKFIVFLFILTSYNVNAEFLCNLYLTLKETNLSLFDQNYRNLKNAKSFEAYNTSFWIVANKLYNESSDPNIVFNFIKNEFKKPRFELNSVEKIEFYKSFILFLDKFEFYQEAYVYSLHIGKKNEDQLKNKIKETLQNWKSEKEVEFAIETATDTIISYNGKKRAIIKPNILIDQRDGYLLNTTSSEIAASLISEELGYQVAIVQEFNLERPFVSNNQNTQGYFEANSRASIQLAINRSLQVFPLSDEPRYEFQVLDYLIGNVDRDHPLKVSKNVLYLPSFDGFIRIAIDAGIASTRDDLLLRSKAFISLPKMQKPIMKEIHYQKLIKLKPELIFQQRPDLLSEKQLRELQKRHKDLLEFITDQIKNYGYENVIQQ